MHRGIGHAWRIRSNGTGQVPSFGPRVERRVREESHVRLAERYPSLAGRKFSIGRVEAPPARVAAPTAHRAQHV
jgi:hypothetical protein